MAKETKPLEWANYGRNIQAAMDGEFLVFRVRVDAATVARAPMAKGQPGKPAKNKLLASSGGNLSVMFDGLPEGLKLGMNVMFPPEAKAA